MEVDSKNVATAAAAFVLPNQSIDPLTPLTHFAVPLATVEAVSGLNFFPSLLSCDDKARLDLGGDYDKKKEKSSLPLALNAAKVLTPEWYSALQASNKSRGSQSNADVSRLLSEGSSFREAKPSNAAVDADAASSNGAISSTRLRPSRELKHLCVIADCRLPKEVWFEAKNGKRNATK